MTDGHEQTRSGSFEQFKDFTLAVARGERPVVAGEPKIWMETGDGAVNANSVVQFASLEAGAKLLSARNRELLRLILTREPRSVAELATLAHRAPQNVQRTLHRLHAAGIVKLSRGAGRTVRPTVTARKVHIEIDLAVEA